MSEISRRTFLLQMGVSTPVLYWVTKGFGQGIPLGMWRADGIRFYQVAASVAALDNTYDFNTYQVAARAGVIDSTYPFNMYQFSVRVAVT